MYKRQGLGWITKFDKDFLDKEFLLKQKEEGISRKLVGFEMQEKAIPRHDYLVVDADGNEICLLYTSRCV